MKISLDFDDNDVVFEVMDAMFIAYLKNFKKSVIEYQETAWNDEDKKENKKIIKACDVILQHYGVKNDNS